MAFKLIVQNGKIVLKTIANYIINANGIKDLFTGSSNVDTNGKIDWTLQHYTTTAANFVSTNPILLVGQLGIESDNLDTQPLFKIGNGIDVWTALPYANPTGGGGTTELDPVISQLNTPPGSPSIGDRYLVNTSPTGAWISKNNNIAEWNGTTWTYTVPVTDYIIYVTSTLDTLRYNGSSWVSWAGTAILQNGNSPTVSLVIGTSNNEIVYIKSNNTNRFSFDSVNTSLVELILNTETANTIPYLDTNKKLKSVTLGSGLSLSSGVLNTTSSGGGTWGSITGTLSNQTDLQTALNAKEDTANKSTNVNTDQASNTKYPSVKAVYDWATGLFIKKGTITNNTILKGSGTDTATDSNITDDGTTVTINSPAIITSDNGNNQVISINSLRALMSHDVKISFDSPIYSFTNMQANEIVETDASKNLVSVAKGTAYNKDFGTGTTNVPAIGSTLGNSLITSTDANGKLQTLTTATYPSLTELSYAKGVTSAIQTQIDSKLTASNNLSDLSNPLTARNNLKIWDLFLTGGDQSTTSNVATNITDLVSPTLTASKRYRIHGVIKVGCNNTGGVKFQITLPSGASMDMSLSGSNTSNTAYINATLTSSATLSASVQSFNGLSMLRVDGEISLGVTAGTIQFGFASGTNTQTSTVYQLGTHLTVTQIN